MSIQSIITGVLRNIPGKPVRDKLVVLESDDWGAVRVPSRKVIETLEAAGYPIGKNPFNRIDALESAEDLELLFQTLRSVTDAAGNPAIITANSIVANPDFEQIAANRFQQYFYETALSTYSRQPSTQSVPQLIRQGMDEKLYQPQFHGREHVHIQSWLRYLRQGQPLLTEAFHLGMYGIDVALPGERRTNLMAAFDKQESNPPEELNQIVSDGVRLFENQFGFRPQSFIAPCYVWAADLEPHLHREGFRLIQGLPYQFEPVQGKTAYKKKLHFQGQRVRRIPEMRYLVRNVFFEPALNPPFNWVGDALSRIEWAFKFHKPAIIGTHRINFSGTIDAEQRNSNLAMLKTLLQEILKKWPDTRFASTDQLVKYYF